MLGETGDDIADVFFEAERVAESRHPPVQPSSVRGPQFRQRNLDVSAGSSHCCKLMDSAKDLGLNFFCAAVFFGHALLTYLFLRRATHPSAESVWQLHYSALRENALKGTQPLSLSSTVAVPPYASGRGILS